jgi:hypothetical protein
MNPNENPAPAPGTPEIVTETVPTNLPETPAAEVAETPEVPVVAPVVAEAAPAPEPVPVDPVRSAAGRRGGERFHQLVRLGMEYEREHGLKAGRQRLRQLVQLGRRYEQERGLAPKPRKRRGDAWQEFLAALARVVKPAHRAAVEQLAAALRSPGAKAA